MALSKTKKEFVLGPLRCNMLIANTFFAILAVVSQTGQIICLPLWIDATKSNSNESSNENLTNNSMIYTSTNSYFVLSFSAFVFVVFFGTITLLIRIINPDEIGEAERNFPNTNLVIVGFFSGLNGLLLVYSSSGTRTPPYLQAILQNVLIPLTVIMRFIVLRKKPTGLKLACTITVMLALFLSFLPKIIPSIEPTTNYRIEHRATGSSVVIWSIIYMLSFVPTTLSYIYEEVGMKLKNSHKKCVNLFWYFTWVFIYQFITLLAFFWTNILPFFGNQPNMESFGKSYVFSLSCFFGGSGCSSLPALRGTLFILFYMICYASGGLLLRYGEGATLLAIVLAFVTPIVFLFWTLFQESPFMFRPHYSNATWFSIAGIVLMFPAVIVYNLGQKEIDEPKEEREALLKNGTEETNSDH